ncbi:MAG: DEAD/DEAH box helicase [Armatimonadetes bacterium]|nr:DEAD/DEAH box helicase [Armatimonadota bacterium]
MTYQDKKCVCRDCEQEFTFSVRMQEQFSQQGFNPPTRCAQCHDKRNGRRVYSRGGACEIHTAPCSLCGKDAELPFKPTPDKPVYCAECFKDRLDAKAQPSPRKFVPRKPEKAIQDTDVPAGVMTFAHLNLDDRLHRAISEAGYEIPTPVQAAAIPIGLEGRDLIGTAQTGTGKTAAFVLPILQHLLANPVEKRCTRAIVLTPTRELAEQINDTFKQLGKFTEIKSATVYGGVAMSPQEKALRTGADVIIACPGRLLDHIDRGNTDFSKVTKLVLDEADRMLDMGFLPPVKRILSHLPGERHSMLFSATFAPELIRFTKDTLRNPERVDVDVCAPPKTIAHALYPCPQHLKTSLVLNLLDKTDVNSVLIFTRTKHRADRVAQQVKNAGYATVALHADRSQNQRQLALDNFRSGRCQILVATDIAARGLDVATISHVINYDIPATADTYIHRIGRTGRMEREGDAMTLVTPLDAAIVFEIEKALGAPIERRKLEDFDYSPPPPTRDDFKRGPNAHHKQSNTTQAPGKARTTATKAGATRSPGYFAEQRMARAKLSGGY